MVVEVFVVVVVLVVVVVVVVVLLLLLIVVVVVVVVRVLLEILVVVVIVLLGVVVVVVVIIILTIVVRLIIRVRVRVVTMMSNRSGNGSSMTSCGSDAGDGSLFCFAWCARQVRNHHRPAVAPAAASPRCASHVPQWPPLLREPPSHGHTSPRAEGVAQSHARYGLSRPHVAEGPPHMTQHVRE